MAYSKEKLKSNGDRASPCFRPFLIGNISDKFLPTRTLLYVSDTFLLALPEFVTRKYKTVGSGKEKFDFRGLRNVGCVKLRSKNFRDFVLFTKYWVMESRRMGDGRQGEGVGWHTRSRCRWQVHLWTSFCDVTDCAMGRSRGERGRRKGSAVTCSRVEGAGKWVRILII